VDYFAGPDLEGEPVATDRFPDSRLLFIGRPRPQVPSGPYSFRAHGRFTPAESGPHGFTLGQSGHGRLLVDGQVVIDGFEVEPPPGTRYFGVVSGDLQASVELEEGRPVDVVIEYSSVGSTYLRGVLVGCRRPCPDDLMDRAVAAASAADVAIVVVGTNDDWETEGEDRSSLALPGEQDELVRRVVAANPRTVVVLNTGAPVTMPWVADVPALLQMWFGGQEMAGALADIVLGAADPGGRLAATFPERIEHNPSYGNFPGEDGEVRYGEGLLVGYRWYDARHLAPLFPFGHGLSYTSFEFGRPTLSASTWEPGATVTVTVPVSNTGSRDGVEVVQAYVAPPPGPRFRPVRELKAFAKVAVAAGATTSVALTFDERSFAAWDPSGPGWSVAPGAYRIHIGRSSADLSQVVTVEVPTGRPAG